MVRFVSTMVLWCWMLVPLSAEVKKEWWAEGTSSASEAFARYQPGRIGVLLVARDSKPEPGVRYWKDSEQRASAPERLPDRYELRLYDVVRQVFKGQGYEVQCLNRNPWQGLRLREVMAQAEGVDAVFAVHYTVEYTHKIGDRVGYTWWTPFKAMQVKVQCAAFDVASGDLIYGLEGETLSTERLYLELGELIAEEPQYPGGYDRQGKRSAYHIAIYHTSFRDPKDGKREIPLIRTGEGAIDISYSRAPAAGEDLRAYDPETLREIRRSDRSILDRLLKHVSYQPLPDEMAYFEALSIEMWGEVLGKKIPRR